METFDVAVARTGDTANGSPARMERSPSDQASSDIQVVDGRANRPITQMRQCSATSCANNVEGGNCSLTAISVNQTGGCADYEPAADDADQQDEQDNQTIIGISELIPAMPDHPSSLGQMVGKFNDGAML